MFEALVIGLLMMMMVYGDDASGRCGAKKL